MKLADLIPKPADFTCPDAGAVKMLPYISGAAMDAAIVWQKEPPKALASILEKLVTGGAEQVAKLSDRDQEQLARFLAGTMEVGDTFDQILASKPLAEAFIEAMKQAPLWSKTEKSNAELQRMYEKFVNPLGLS